MDAFFNFLVFITNFEDPNLKVRWKRMILWNIYRMLGSNSSNTWDAYTGFQNFCLINVTDVKLFQDGYIFVLKTIRFCIQWSWSFVEWPYVFVKKRKRYFLSSNYFIKTNTFHERMVFLFLSFLFFYSVFLFFDTFLIQCYKKVAIRLLFQGYFYCCYLERRGNSILMFIGKFEERNRKRYFSVIVLRWDGNNKFRVDESGALTFWIV